MSSPDLSSAPLRQQWLSPTAPRPIALLGAGGIVRAAHLPAYRRLGLPVLGLFDIDGERARALAEEFRVAEIYPDLDTAVRRGAAEGAVFDVAVPAPALSEILDCLPDGSAVLIQKPFGRDLDEALRLLEICKSKALTAAVNFQLRFSPGVLALADALRRDLLGTVTDLEVRINVHTPWDQWEFLRGIPRHEILYHSIHYLDLVRSLLGEPEGVYCKVARDPALPDYSDTRSATVLDYGDRLRCVATAHHAHRFGPRHAMSQLKVEGTRGAAVLRLGVNLDYPRGLPDTLELALGEGDTWRDVPLRGSWFDHAFEGPMANLQRYLEGSDPVLHTRVEDAARTMALVECCYRSSAAGGLPLPAMPLPAMPPPDAAPPDLAPPTAPPFTGQPR